MTVNATPAVKVTAKRLGVDLAKVTGSGAGGRIKVDDVRAAAPARPKPSTDDAVFASLFGGAPSRRVAAAVAAGARATERPSRFVGQVQVQVTVDEYGSNPLLDDVRQALPAIYATETREGQAPSLFETGDLPLFTTSGIEPSLLSRLPWPARHPAARAERAMVSQIFESYATAGSVEDAADKAAMAWLDFGGDSGNRDYYDRVTRWASGVGARTLKAE